MKIRWHVARSSKCNSEHLMTQRIIDRVIGKEWLLKSKRRWRFNYIIHCVNCKNLIKRLGFYCWCSISLFLSLSSCFSIFRICPRQLIVLNLWRFNWFIVAILRWYLEPNKYKKVFEFDTILFHFFTAQFFHQFNNWFTFSRLSTGFNFQSRNSIQLNSISCW